MTITMRTLLIVGMVLFLTGCSANQKRSMMVDAGMTKAELLSVMGMPSGRSFRGTSEALQYQEIALVGNCRYTTVWLDNGLVSAITSRIGPSVMGCSFGSKEVDWGQKPKPSIDININTNPTPRRTLPAQQ